MTKKIESQSAPAAETILGVEETYKDYFLQYASYVITDRAIPDLYDGLKPVQRRILHSLWENEDVVGHCMKYHPHGDASIYAAMVGMGQKQLLIDTQGNWGDPSTNDPAAAARYIEARLTHFAKDVVFSPHLTTYKLSYDGRNKEPVQLPVRVPLLLATGAEGIAVGLTTRVLPHNLAELLEAQKAYFKKEDFRVYPDFPTGGLMDVKDYSDGLQGSRVKVRAVLERQSGKSIVIREIPYGTTTESLIDSILRASDKGKIKVAKIQDNSAAEIEIIVTFQRGVDMEKAEAALYAFTDCETSLSSNCTVIKEGKPVELSVSQILTETADHTKALLKRDLEIQLEKLENQWHLKSLVQIFIENRIYLRIEKCETWVDVLYEIEKGLEPHLETLKRPVTEEDLIYLTEVKIRRISKWDSEKAREELDRIDNEIEAVQKDLRRITNYTIRFLDRLLETYGKTKTRRTKIVSFDSVEAVSVVERTQKLYLEPKAGFIGTDLKNGKLLGSCSSLDDVMIILRDGGLLITKVADRKYVGENVCHAQLFSAGDRKTTFNLVYEDLTRERTYAKRFQVGGYTRDRHYQLGISKKTRVLFVSLGSPCFAHVKLKRKPRIKTDLYISFEDLLIKGRSANGIMITKHKVSSVKEISSAAYQDSVSTTEKSAEKKDTSSTRTTRIRADRQSAKPDPDDDDQPLLFAVDDPKRSP
jgi:topoisomerase-4 subunit A